MIQSSFMELIYNAALLLALGVVFDSITLRGFKNSFLTKVLSGFFMGAVAMGIMANPWVLSSGIVFDTRSILLSVGAMFFGLIPSLIAASMAIAMRIYNGGNGAMVGSLVILASVGLGLIWRSNHRIWGKSYGFWELYTLGVYSSAVMLALMLLLPNDAGIHVISQIYFPVLTIYPIATLILGQILGRSMQRWREGEELKVLSARQKAILFSVPDIIMEVDVNKVYTWANRAGYDFFGPDLIGKQAADYFIRGQQTYDLVQPLFEGDEHLIYVESWQRRQDGEERLLAWWCKVLKDERGTIKGAISTARDITSQKAMEEELNSYFTNALDLFCIADTDGYFRRLNKAWELSLGYKLEDLENSKFMDFVHPDDIDATLQAIQSLAAQKEILSFINRYKHKDGSYRWIEWRSYPAGKRIFSAARDITEMKIAQDALRESQSRFSQFMDQIPGNVFIKDTSSRLLYVNKHMIVDHQAASWMGKLPSEILAAEEAEGVEASDQEVLAKGFLQMFDTYDDNPEDVKHYETIKFTIQREDAEPLIGGISLNVTARKNAENERNRFAQRMEILHMIDSLVLESRSLQEVGPSLLTKLQILIPCEILSINEFVGGQSTPVALVSSSEYYKHLTVNQPYYISPRLIAELKEKQSIVINEANINQKQDDTPMRNALIDSGMQSFMYAALLVRGEIMGFVALTSTKIGFFTEEYQAYAIEFANQISLAMNQLRLIEATQKHASEMEQKVKERTAQLLLANKEMESFSYTVAHDLRTPLRSIDGFSNILLQDHAAQLDDEAKGLLQRVTYNANKMGSLINALLRLAKLSRDSVKIIPLQMENMVKEILEDIITPHLAMEFEVQLDELPEVMADPDLIAQVWTNLLSNAVKFTMPMHDKKIHIGSYPQGDRIVFFVRDSGVGFNDAYVNKLFCTFQRLHKEADFEGTGIGLASVKRIIDRHHGEVWAESELNKGACFYFTLQAR